MIEDNLTEYSFKNKGTAKTQTLSLASILLVQNFTDAGEAGVEEIASAIETCKRSLNQSWGYSGKTLRCSSQYSASTEIEYSNKILAEFRDRILSLEKNVSGGPLFMDGERN